MRLYFVPCGATRIFSVPRADPDETDECNRYPIAISQIRGRFQWPQHRYQARQSEHGSLLYFRQEVRFLIWKSDRVVDRLDRDRLMAEPEAVFFGVQAGTGATYAEAV